VSAISLRLPNSLHDRLRELAAREGISLNQLLTLAAAEKVATILAFDWLEERARASDLGAFDALLRRVPAVPAAPGDDLPRTSRPGRPRQGARARAGKIAERPGRYRPRKGERPAGRRKK